MHARRLISAALVVAFSAFLAAPSEANILTSATVNENCKDFTIVVNGKDLHKPSSVSYSISLAAQGQNPITVNGVIPVKPDKFGNFHALQKGFWRQFGVHLDNAYNLSGKATLKSSGSTVDIVFTPPTLSCAPHVSFCPLKSMNLSEPFTYAALGVGDNHSQNAQIQGQQGSQIFGIAGISGPHGQIQLQSWQQFNIQGLITGTAYVQPDTKIQLDSNSFIQGGVKVDTTDPPAAAAAAVAANAAYGQLAATMGPSDINDQGPNNGPHQVVTITGTNSTQNVLQLGQLQLQNIDLYIQAPASSTFIINVSKQAQIRNSNIFAQGIPSSHILINMVGNAQFQAQNEADPDPDPDEQIQASILAPLSNNIQVESTEIFGDLIFGQQFQVKENSLVLGCNPPPNPQLRVKMFTRGSRYIR